MEDLQKGPSLSIRRVGLPPLLSVQIVRPSASVRPTSLEDSGAQRKNRSDNIHNTGVSGYSDTVVRANLATGLGHF